MGWEKWHFDSDAAEGRKLNLSAMSRWGRGAAAGLLDQQQRAEHEPAGKERLQESTCCFHRDFFIIFFLAAGLVAQPLQAQNSFFFHQ